MQLRLAHGREDPSEEMDGWGFDGPTLLQVHSMQQMYGQTYTVAFVTDDATNEAKRLTGWPTWDRKCLAMPNRNGLIETHEPGEPPRYDADLFLYPAATPTPNAPPLRRSSCAHLSRCTKQFARMVRDEAAALTAEGRRHLHQLPASASARKRRQLEKQPARLLFDHDQGRGPRTCHLLPLRQHVVLLIEYPLAESTCRNEPLSRLHLFAHIP